MTRSFVCLEENQVAKKKQGGNTTALIRKLAEPIAGELGLKIWDIRFLKEGADWFLRIFIDKESGVNIEDCEAMSRAINSPLDELDPIEQSYYLEVCSPGLNRALTRDEHFEQFAGSPVTVRLIRPLPDGRKELKAILEGYSDGMLQLSTEEGPFECARKDTVSVRLDEDEVGGLEE